ncbi:hypothetical protein [Xenorhabdus szentirmaii]|uniref:Similarities with putative methyltransferases n=1 Tax=Xenorhabdus szentirmaii DSM 16338 TaxID=1427518 RepID=W1J3K1_9GAMM
MNNPDLIIAAQSFQWMDRERVLELARSSLADNGVMAILQNNRDYRYSEFLNEYEDLLEELSPNYSCHYRDFDYAQELNTTFRHEENVNQITLNIWWNMIIPNEEFIGMASSSTQVQLFRFHKPRGSIGELFPILDAGNSGLFIVGAAVFF